MPKRKIDQIDPLFTRFKKYQMTYQLKDNKQANLLYYCFLHDDDKEICNIYECNGKGLKYKNNTNYIK
jgi:hypothetical protein